MVIGGGITLRAQVESYVGTITDTASLDQFLSDSAKILVDVIPDGKLDSFMVGVAVDDSGASCSSYRIVSASNAGRKARGFPADRKAELSDAHSIHQATAFSPGFYIEGGKLYVVPASSSRLFYGIPYPTVLNTDTSIASFPVPLVPAVVLDAASRSLGRKMVDFIVNTLSTLAFNNQTAPMPPTMLAVVVDDAIAATVSAPTWDSFGDAPVFTPPSVTLPTKPGNFSTSAVAPTPPDAPAFTYTDALAQIIGAVTIAALPTPPAFTYGTNNPMPASSTAPTVDFSDLIAPTAPGPAGIAYSDVTPSTIGTVTIGSLGTAPSFAYQTANTLPANSTLTQPDLSALTVPTVPALPTSSDIPYTAAAVDATVFSSVLDISTELTAASIGLATVLDTNQDVELATAKINKIQMLIQKFLQESDLNIKTTLAKNQLTTDLNLRNAAQVLAQGVQIYQAKLAQYSQALDGFKNTLARQVSDYQLKQADFDAKAKYSLQDALERFNGANVAYQANLQVVLDQAKLDANKVLQQAQLTTDTGLKNALQDTAAAVQSYTIALERYKAQLQGYQTQVQARVSQYQIQVEVFKAKADISLSDAKARFDQDVTAYQAVITRNLKQAEIAVQTALQQAQLTTDVDLKNRAEELAAQVQQYQARLQNYSTQMEGYKALIESQVSVFQANLTLWTKDADNQLQKYQGDIALAKAAFDAQTVVYQAMVQKAVKKAEMDQERMLSVAKMETDVEIANMQYQVESGIAANKNLLELFADEVQSYQVSVTQEVQRFGNVLQQLMAEVKSWMERSADLRGLYTQTVQMYLGAGAQKQ
jgi:hypothetical protein